MALKLLAILGVALVIAGVTLIFWPAGLVTAGAFALFFAYSEG